MKKCLLFLLLLVFCLVGCGKSDADSNSYEGIYSMCYTRTDDVCYEDTFVQFSEGIFISYKSTNKEPITIEYGKSYEECFNTPFDDSISIKDLSYSQFEEIKGYLNSKYKIEALNISSYRDMGEGYLYMLDLEAVMKYIDGKIILISSSNPSSSDFTRYLKKIKDI